MHTFSPGWVCALWLFWWELNCDLSPSMHLICWVGWMGRRSVQLMGSRASQRGLCLLLAHSLTAEQCQGPWANSVTSVVNHGATQPLASCGTCDTDRHREVTGQGSLGIPHSPCCGECATGDSCTALSLWVRATTLLIVFHGTVQPCLIFLPSLLHKFSWPGKFLRGQ